MPVRQLFLENKFLTLKEVCKPLLDDYSVLIAVSYSFISSGKEVSEIVEHNNAYFFKNIPSKIKKVFDLIMNQGGIQTKRIVSDRLTGRIIPIGQSCSGRVIAVGKKVKRLSTGDFVACVGEGFANHAEFVCVPEHLAVRISKQEQLKHASLIGVGTIAMQSVRRAALSIGETVCVIGADTVGQLIIQIANRAGCRVITVDKNDWKLAQAKKAGAEYAHTTDSPHLQESIDYTTQSCGVDCTIITPEYIHEDYINFATSITRKKGRIVITDSRTISITQERVQQKELDILLALAYGPGRYDADYEYQGHDYPYAYVRWTENRNMQAFINLIESQKLTVDYLLEHEIVLENTTKMLQEIDTASTLGIIVTYQKHTEEPPACVPTKKDLDAYVPARKDPSSPLNVTFFGASRATRLTLLPIMRNIKNIAVHKVIDRDISLALNAAKMYTGAIAISGDSELFYDDPTTDVVVVTSGSHIHVEHVIKALKNNKSVYLHKTPPLDHDTHKRLYEYLRTNDQACLGFGYYRTSAPFIRKIKHAVSFRSSPLMISYRLNLGGIGDTDIADMRPRHGNIIDKASHIFDLFYHLVAAKPLALSVEVLHPIQENIFATDNFVTHISFADGSLCSLQFTSLGHYDAGIERMEVHFDGKTIIMDDFVRLNGFGLARTFDEVVRIPDKGREAHLKNFFNTVNTPQAKFDINAFDVVSNLTMHVDHLVCQGGGELDRM